MDAVLGFFSDLILFTAGLGVVLLWLIIFVVIADEVIDLFVESRNKKEEADA